MTLAAMLSDADFLRLRQLQARFSPFAALSVERRETCHTSLLAWLLDAQGSHRLGAAFLRRFLGLCPGPHVLNFEADPIADVFTERVFIAQGYGDDLAGKKGANDGDSLELGRNRVDIILEGPKWLVAIEAKIDSKEGPHQLQRYHKALSHYCRDAHKAFTLIYLTVDDEQHVVDAALRECCVGGSEPNIVNFTWKEAVADTLDGLLDEPLLQQSHQGEFLRSYVGLLESITDPDQSEEEQVRQRLRDNHADVLKALKSKLAKPTLTGIERDLYLRNVQLIDPLLRGLVPSSFRFFEELSASVVKATGIKCRRESAQSRALTINDDFELVLEFRASKPDVEVRIATRPEGNRERQVTTIHRLRQQLIDTPKGNPWHCLFGRSCGSFSSATDQPSWVKVWSKTLKVLDWSPEYGPGEAVEPQPKLAADTSSIKQLVEELKNEIGRVQTPANLAPSSAPQAQPAT